MKKDLVIINVAKPPKMINRILSAIRGYVKHAFGSMTMSMDGTVPRRIRIGRIRSGEIYKVLHSATYVFYK